MAKHHKQIAYVEPNTLIVGIDIGKAVHFVKMMLDGRQIAAFKLYNEGHAFMSLLDKMRQIQNKHQCKASLIGMEPTGHYWLPLAYFLRAHKQSFVLIQPSHVRWSKEMGDNSPLKTDEKDAGVIADMVRQGKSQSAYLPEGVYAHLRRLTARVRPSSSVIPDHAYSATCPAIERANSTIAPPMGASSCRTEATTTAPDALFSTANLLSGCPTCSSTSIITRSPPQCHINPATRTITTTPINPLNTTILLILYSLQATLTHLSCASSFDSASPDFYFLQKQPQRSPQIHQ